MQVTRTTEQEAAEDIFFGQAVLIWARWFLIAAGAVLVLWSFDEQGKLIKGTVPIVALMGMNFYLHGRYLMEQPVRAPLIVLTSVLDLVVISLLVAFWPLGEGQETNLDNQFFLFYYPMVIGFAFVMPRRIEFIYTLGATAAYAAVMAVTVDWPSDSTALQTELKTLLERLIALGAVGFLANYYWRIQRARRREAQAGLAR